MPKEKAKNSKSTKTARVLSLLTTPEEMEGGAEAASLTASTSENIRRAKDEAAQAEIRDALASELDDLLPKQIAQEMPHASAAAAPAQPTASAQTPAPTQPAAPTARAQQPVAAPADPAALQPAPIRPVVQTYAPETVPSVHADEHAYRDFCVVNITQSLVEAKTDKYMKLFGMCGCAHCRMDVIALALSNLPAKYVVANNKDVVPLLSMYESKYSAAIITQVMSACKTVLQHPHHKR